MLELFIEQKEISALAASCMFVSIVLRIILGSALSHLIKETDNMATTNSHFLKQCRMKYENIYQMNSKVPNVAAFVDHCTSRLTFGRFRLEGIYHFSGQAMLASMVCIGIGVCKAIIEGKTLGEIMPFYLFSLVGLYLFFSVSAVVNLEQKKKELKTCLIDYLENHLSFRMETVEAMQQEKPYTIPEKDTGSAEVSKEELEALLSEFLAM